MDINITLERMNEGPVRPEVRDMYPELAHIFDALDDMREDIRDHGNPVLLSEDLNAAHQEQKTHEDTLNEVTARFAQLRDMADVLVHMDKPRPCDIGRLAELADDAIRYVERS